MSATNEQLARQDEIVKQAIAHNDWWVVVSLYGSLTFYPSEHDARDRMVRTDRLFTVTLSDWAEAT